MVYEVFFFIDLCRLDIVNGESIWRHPLIIGQFEKIKMASKRASI